MLIAFVVTRNMTLPMSTDVVLSITALAAILGHNYTPFLGFKGGKGVNTTLGSFFIIAPVPTLSAVAVYYLLRLFTPIVSIRSITLGITLPLVCILMKLSGAIITAAAVSALLIIWRHKSNIKRLINKEEK